MNGDMTTAPTLPPPGPGVGPPAFGVFAACSPQHDSAPFSDSSKVTISKPSSLNPFVVSSIGIHFCRKSLTDRSPPGSFDPLHGSSWPSGHRFGVMKLNDGVVPAWAISPGMGG